MHPKLCVEYRRPNLVVHDGNSADIVFGYSDALVFEPQLFPDVSNHTNFPSAHLDPGGTYENTMVYRFSVLKH